LQAEIDKLERAEQIPRDHEPPHSREGC
jgi:hypothetical protein